MVLLGFHVLKHHYFAFALVYLRTQIDSLTGSNVCLSNGFNIWKINPKVLSPESSTVPKLLQMEGVENQTSKRTDQ